MNLTDPTARPADDAVWCEQRGRWTQGRNRPVFVPRGRQLVASWAVLPTGGAR